MDQAEVDHRFAFHAATTEEKRMAHGSVRMECQDLALFLNEKLPDGREKAVAITKLEEVMFWANAALARHKE
jgi:hypothetical protein